MKEEQGVVTILRSHKFGDLLKILVLNLWYARTGRARNAKMQKVWHSQCMAFSV